ncbi:hypothetical protein H4S02_004303 [Coemansia sp. RSA 2611]|nr:hypothetical protein H4S02_004303 [Coemansia sp. RSA 2611]
MDMYAAYAGAAYNISDTWNCGYECEHPGTEDTHVEYRWDAPLITSDGYIARNPSRKIIIVAFRGSAEAGDWIEDFTGNPVQWPETIADSIVVLGFLSGYLVSSSSVVQHTAKLAAQYPDHGISAVGHSLGGARAAMFVADISIKHPQLLPRVQLYTYGQAKVGNPAFAAYMNGLGMPIYRVVNRGDIAPHLPYNNSRIVHFGTEVWITANNKTVVCQSNDYSLCSESLPPAAFNIRDHSTYPGL